MEIRNLVSFLAVAEEQNFSRAAQRLGYVQSTITMQIKQLEAELGVSLFDRIGKAVYITEAGEQLRPIAAQILRLAGEASRIGAACQTVQGPLRIGVLESLQNLCLPGLIHTYHHLYPAGTLTVKTGPIASLQQRLLKNQLDLIFICNERYHDESLLTLWEKKEEAWFVASPAHPLAGRASLSLAEVLESTFLQTENDSSYGLALGRYAAEQGLSISSYLDIENPDIILQLVRQNDGISFLPRYIAERDIAAGTLVRLSCDTSAISIWIQLLCRRDKSISSAMAAFLALVKEQMGE